MKKQKKSILISGVFMAFIALTIFVPASAQSAFIGTWCQFQVNGTNIEGESTVTSMDREGWSEVMVAGADLIVPIDPATGASSGKRQHRPFTIIMPIEQSLPLLYKALAMKEPVDQLRCRFFRTSPSGSGAEEHFYTILIENGFIASINTTFDASSQFTEARAVVSVVFQDITWTYEIGGAGGATFTDSWRAGY